MKSEDETKIFKEVLQSLSARAPADMNAIIGQMGDQNKKRIRELYKTTQIEYTDEQGST
jgi:predicted oxidoreductase